MMVSAFHSIGLMVRVSVFIAVLAGPLCAMTLQKEKGFASDQGAIGLVLLNSIQRG